MSGRKTYFITDPSTRFIGAHRLAEKQKTIDLTEAEAKFFLEGGGLSETDPNAKPKDDEAEPAKGKGASHPNKAA